MDQAVIRCTLATSDEDNRMIHAHRLVRRENNEDVDDPHEIPVSQYNNYTAEYAFRACSLFYFLIRVLARSHQY